MLKGQEFTDVNGGGYFDRFHDNISLTANCENQQQIDEVWEKLSRDGELQPCGWVKDRFGVSWQIALSLLWEIDEGEERTRAQRVMNTRYPMNRIDIEKVLQA